MTRTLLLLVLMTAGCGGDDGEVTTGERMCLRMQQCDITLSMTFDGCTEHMDDLFDTQTVECGRCMTTLSCPALVQTFRGEVTYCDMCR